MTRALIVDREAWVPESGDFAVLLRAEVPELERRREWLETRSGESEPPIILAERVWLLSSEEPAQLVLVRDQIASFDPTLVEVRDDAGRVRFPDMSAPFAVEWLERARAAAEARGLRARTGCVVGIQAPELLTAAECAALARLGGDAACRWMHLETRWAAALGRKVFGLGVAHETPDSVVAGLIARLFAH